MAYARCLQSITADTIPARRTRQQTTHQHNRGAVRQYVYIRLAATQEFRFCPIFVASASLPSASQTERHTQTTPETKMRRCTMLPGLIRPALPQQAAWVTHVYGQCPRRQCEVKSCGVGLCHSSKFHTVQHKIAPVHASSTICVCKQVKVDNLIIRQIHSTARRHFLVTMQLPAR